MHLSTLSTAPTTATASNIYTVIKGVVKKMKFTINKQYFQKCINTVLHVAYNNKAQKSILECIHIEAKDNKIIMDAFDTVTAIKTETYADIREEGECAIPARMLADVVIKLAESDITIEKNEENGIRLTCSNTTIVLQEMDARQFPAFPEVTGSAFAMESFRLREVVGGTAFSVYQMPDKPIITGLLLESQENLLNVVGIDGIRMAKMTVKKTPTEDFRVVVPVKAMKEAARIMGDLEEEPIKIVTDKNSCFFVSDDTTIYTRLLEGEYMNYRNLIPASFKTHVKVNVGLLEDSLNMVSVMSREISTNPVKIVLKHDSMELTSKSEYGTATDVVSCKMSGESMSIYVNARYLLDVLKVVDDDEVMLEFENGLKPYIIRPVEGDDYIYMIVPLNIRD